jgi:putative endonuclease
VRPAGRRRRAERRGRLAESLAVLLLRAKGYRILARRLKSPAGEIDVVAAKGRLLAVVEVKARANLADAIIAVGPGQRRRLARAAALWLAARREAAPLTVRFDLVLVAPWRWPRHIAGAWAEDGSW